MDYRELTMSAERPVRRLLHRPGQLTTVPWNRVMAEEWGRGQIQVMFYRGVDGTRRLYE